MTHHDDGEEQLGFEFLGVAQLAQLIEPIERLQPRLGVQIAVAADHGGPLLAFVVGVQFSGRRTFGHLVALIGQSARKQRVTWVRWEAAPDHGLQVPVFHLLLALLQGADGVVGLFHFGLDGIQLDLQVHVEVGVDGGAGRVHLLLHTSLARHNGSRRFGVISDDLSGR